MQFAADTPINRASIKELSIDELEALVVRMQERRMRSYTAYQAAQEAKEKIKHEKDSARYEKVLEMAGKKFEAAEKALEAASKYVNELKVLQLMLGE
jgi:ribosomal protein S11